MSFKMECPRCMKTLNVTEKAFGRTVPCPSCNQPIKVSQPARVPSSASPVERWSPGDATAQESLAARMPPVQLPAGMPPMPDGDPPVQSPSDPLAFLQSGSGPTALDGTTAGRRDSVVSSGFAEGPPNLAEEEVLRLRLQCGSSALRHPKESAYFTIAAIAGTLGWLCLIPIILMFFWVAIPILIGLWISKQRYRAEMLGNSVKVGRNQYSELFEIVERHCRALGLAVPPAVFVVNSNGVVNAFAEKILKDKYVVLYSDLIDLMLSHGSTN